MKTTLEKIKKEFNLIRIAHKIEKVFKKYPLDELILRYPIYQEYNFDKEIMDFFYEYSNDPNRCEWLIILRK